MTWRGACGCVFGWQVIFTGMFVALGESGIPGKGKRGA